MPVKYVFVTGGVVSGLDVYKRQACDIKPHAKVHIRASAVVAHKKLLPCMVQILICKTTSLIY